MSSGLLVGAGLRTSAKPSHAIVDGEGVWLIRKDGQRILDASNTGAPLGHRHPAMVGALASVGQLPVVNESKPWHERELAAAELVEHALGNEDWVGSVRFGMSGSEVNDLALSLAQAVTGRRPLATRERAYHGLVGLARDVTVQPQWHGGLSYLDGPASRPASLTDVRVLPAPQGGTLWERIPSEPARSPQELRAGASAQLADVAAVILDYTQGGHYYQPHYQDTMAAVANEQDACWIADEVVTGHGRTGHWMQFQASASRPDIVTLGKPLGGGSAAAGAVVLSRRLTDVLDSAKWQNYSTFRGHPVTITAIRAHLRAAKRENLPQRAAALGEWIAPRLVQIARQYPLVARVAGAGLHWTIDLAGSDWQTWESTTDQRQLSDVVVAAAAERGVSISTSDEPSSLFLAPPLIISEQELEQVLSALDHGLAVAHKEVPQ